MAGNPPQGAYQSADIQPISRIDFNAHRSNAWEKNISEIGRREIQEFLVEQKKNGNVRNGEKLSATSANMMLSVLNLAFEYACDMEYIEVNPCMRVRRIKAETKKVEAFTVEEQQTMEMEIERSNDRRLPVYPLLLQDKYRFTGELQ